MTRTDEPVNILLVEDNAGDRILFKETLHETGIKFDLIESNSVSNAIVQVNNHKPDIIFMDIMMPVINGADYVQSMRNDPLLHATPVVFLTGVIEGKQKRELNIGGFLFPALGKPVNAVDLKESIQEALNKE